MKYLLNLIIICSLMFCMNNLYGQRMIDATFKTYEIVHDSTSKLNDTLPLPNVEIFIINKSNLTDTVRHFITNSKGAIDTFITFNDLYNNIIGAKKENYQVITAFTGTFEPNLKRYVHEFILTKQNN